MSSMLACPECGNWYPESFDACPVDGTPLAPSQDEDPLIGALLGGTYRIERFLDSGGMADVYLAEHERLGRKLAVKVLNPTHSSKQEVHLRFSREARTVAALRHPGIVDVIDCDTTDDGLAYMVMELLAGETLGSILAREGLLEVDRAIEVAAKTADALQAAHDAGIVHRDIKPGNIFLAKGASGLEQVKVLDFGIARLAGTSHLTLQGEVLGTPQYSSPEQARGDDELDHRSDIYSLGATLFHAVCGRPPFDAETPIATLIQHLTTPPPMPRELRPDLPRALEKLLLRMLEKSPARRVQSAEEVKLGLAAVSSSRDRATTGPMVKPVTGGLQEIRVVTALVADIDVKGIDDIEAHAAATSEAFELLGEEVRRQGGTVDHLAGNRAFGLFGLTVSFGDEPLRAVRSARAAQLRSAEGVEFRIAVGTGRALSQSSVNLTGPAASAAARLLERITSGIVVDAATYARARGAYRGYSSFDDALEEPAYLLEERAEPVELMTPSGIALETESAMVGRQGQLEQLLKTLKQVIKERKPRVVLLTGDPGVGKSRLKTELILEADAMDDLDVTYFEGAAQPFGMEQPFSVLGVILRARAGLPLNCTESEALERLRRLVVQQGIKRDVDVHAELLSVVARLGGSTSAALATLFESSPRRLRERVISSFATLMKSIARSKPVLFCIEDAHCIDSASTEALVHLLNEGADLPILVLVLGRPEARDRLGEVNDPIQVELKPLSRADTSVLLRQILRSEPPAELEEAVWERTEGVPLFVEELFFTLSQKGALLPDGSSWKLEREISLFDVPPSIEGVVQSRLDVLESELKQVVRQAAVFGTTFWDHALETLGAHNDIERQLAELTTRDVLVPLYRSTISGCREYRFPSTLLRDVAYRMLPSHDRKNLHSKAADWLSERGAEPAVLGLHLERAQRTNEAAAQYLRAGDIACRSFSNDEALRHYEQALDLTKDQLREPGESWAARLTIGALFGKETVLTRLGRREEALESVDLAEQEAIAQGDQERAAQAMVRKGALVRLVDPREALQILEGALVKVRDTGDVEWESIVSRQLAQAAAFSGDLDRGTEAATHAVEKARAVDAPLLVLRALMVLGTIATIRDGHSCGLGPFEEALEIARTVGDVETEADLLQRCGFLRSELGDVDSAIDDLDAAQELCRRTGNRRVQTFTIHNYGWVLWKQGRRDEAYRAEQEALRLSQEIQLHHVELGTEIYLALIDLGQDRPRDALDRGKRVHEASVVAGYAEPQIHASMIKALGHLELDDRDRAMEEARRAVAAYHDHGGTQQFEVELHLVAWAAFSAAGRYDEASTSLDDARSALGRRLEPINEPEEEHRLIQSIGLGLPGVIRDRCEDLVVKPSHHDDRLKE